MRLPSFIKLPNNRKFKFSARHYDPVKDDLDQRISESKNTKKNTLKGIDNHLKLVPQNFNYS